MGGGKNPFENLEVVAPQKNGEAYNFPVTETKSVSYILGYAVPNHNVGDIINIMDYQMNSASTIYSVIYFDASGTFHQRTMNPSYNATYSNGVITSGLPVNAGYGNMTLCKVLN